MIPVSKQIQSANSEIATIKSSIPKKTSQLTNDSNYVSDASYVHTDVNFTSALKTKLDGINISYGTAAPSGGSSGNIYLQYF